jgi:peptide/nickel transport system substrate-binding protein
MNKTIRASTFLICALSLLLSLSVIVAQEMTYSEAPTLAEQVTAGALPSVEERLPAVPRVVEPVESVGQYGGTWRLGTRGGGDDAMFTRYVGYHNLVRWQIGWTEVIPDVAESYESNDEGTVFTFHLREGMKWSDGQPFTADDILFTVNDIYLNPELFPAPPTWLVSGGEPVVAEKLDDYTVQFTFAAPNGLFVQNLATPNSSPLTAQPKHYLSQFHATYADVAELDTLVQEVGVESWTELFNQKGGFVSGQPNTLWNNAELPTVYAWRVDAPLGPEATQVRLVRNPYFYAVDTDGNQLPYIDDLVFNVGQDVETLVLQALNGEIDMQDRHIGTNANRAVFFDSQEAGGYHFFETVPSSSNVMVIALNLTNQDPTKREIYQNLDFRIGLSHAINREEIIDVVYVGQGQPYQVAPRPQSPLYHERLATQYLEFNPDLANEYLDKVLPDKDGEGFRLMSNGERLVIAMEVIATLQPEWVDALELVEDYWADVGVDMEMVVEDRTIFYDRKEANQHDANIWGGDGGLEVILEPRWYFPAGGESNFAPAWQYWYNNPNDERAEEPPEAVRQQMDLFVELRATADPEAQNELMTRILDIAAEQFYVIGISLPSNGYGIVKNNMHNVPETFLNAYLYPHPGPTNTFTYYFGE